MSKCEPSADGRALDRKPSTAFCKICRCGGSTERLIQPCRCRGSVGHVHLSCLERWLNERGFDRCELCLFRFAALRTRRYPVWRSMAVWARDPRNRAVLYTDLIVVAVLTAVAVLLITVLVAFAVDTGRAGANSYADLLVRCLTVACAAVVAVGYVFSTLTVVGNVCLAWYTWWRSCNDIRLRRERQPPA